MTAEDQHPDNQDKTYTAPNDNEAWEDKSCEDNGMFSGDNYERFLLIQYVACNMNDKAGGIPYSWIHLDSKFTVDVFMNKKLLKNIHDAKMCLS